MARRLEALLKYLEIQLVSGPKKLILDALLEFIPDETLKQRIIKDCMLRGDVRSLWRNIETASTQLSIPHAIEALLVKWTFPRLDVNVSVQNTHLIKVPFSVHPDTGKVCVPIRMDAIDDFVVESAPTLHSLASDPDCLKPYIAHFTSFAYSL